MGDRFYEQQKRRSKGTMTFALDGLEGIERNLQEFELRVRKNISRRALRAAANVIKTAINQEVQHVPIDPGARLFLKRNIAVTVSKVKRSTIYAKVRFRSIDPNERAARKDRTNAAWYYHLFEFGRRAGSNGKRSWGMIPAYGFIRRGFRKAQGRALQVVGERFRIEMEKERFKKARVQR
jgi:HK97 gp10 family phage protein